MKKIVYTAIVVPVVMVLVTLIWDRGNRNTPEIHSKKKTIQNFHDTTFDNAQHGERLIQNKKMARKQGKQDEKPTTDRSAYGPLPKSLQGTRPDGEFLTDNDGNLLIHSSIRRRFDYYLSAVSEKGLETCLGRIEENIETSLPPKAAEQALEILESYMDYKKSLLPLFDRNKPSPDSPTSVNTIRTLFETRNNLRRIHMTPEVVEAFFGEEERYDSYSLKRLDIYYDESMSPEQKKQRLAEINQEFH